MKILRLEYFSVSGIRHFYHSGPNSSTELFCLPDLHVKLVDRPLLTCFEKSKNDQLTKRNLDHFDQSHFLKAPDTGGHAEFLENYI